MKTLKYLIAFAAFAAVATASYAQTAGPATGAPLQKGQGGHGWKAQQALFAKLNLTDTQKAKIKDLFKKMQEETKPIHEQFKNNPDKTAMREKMKPIRKEFMEGVKEILTPAQQAQLKELMKERREKNQAKPVNP